MAIVNPKNLNGWIDFTTTIKAPEVREEFLNIYAVINGQIDGDNIKAGAISGIHLADGSVTAEKLSGNIPASKITGLLSAEQLPGNLVYDTGGTLTGPLNYNVASGIPFLRNANGTGEEVVLLESGAGAEKIKVIVGGTTLFKITVGGVVRFVINKDGTVIPLKFIVPGV